MARKRDTEKVMLRAEEAKGLLRTPQHVPERTGPPVRAYLRLHVPVVQLGAQPVARYPSPYPADSGR